MSKGDTFENDILKLIFNATTIANIAINATSSPLTSLFVALHTADPTDSGSQTSSEATYVGYTRATVTRDSSGWTVSGNTVSNTAAVTFPACTSGSSTVTFFSIGVAVSSTSKALYIGAIGTPAAGLAVTTGITPSFAIGALTVTED